MWAGFRFVSPARIDEFDRDQNQKPMNAILIRVIGGIPAAQPSQLPMNA